MHNQESQPLLPEPDNTNDRRGYAPIPSRWTLRWKATPYWYISHFIISFVFRLRHFRLIPVILTVFMAVGFDC